LRQQHDQAGRTDGVQAGLVVCAGQRREAP